jgi:ABC-2 type transport system permease protein
MTGPVAAHPLPARRAPAAVASLLRFGGARAVLETRQFFREVDAVIFTFAFPTILLAIFGTVFGSESAGGVSFAHYFVPGLLAAGLFLASFQTLAITIALERDNGTLKRLAGSPMPPTVYFAGKIGLVLVTAVFQAVLLLAVAALAFDVPLPTGVGRWATLGWVSALSLVSGTLLGVAFSSVPRSGRSASAVVAPIVLVLQFISGVFFVFTDLPSWLQQVAAVFPLKWSAQGMRAVFLPDTFAAEELAGSWELGRVALVLALWAVAGLVLCLRTFRWQRWTDG